MTTKIVIEAEPDKVIVKVTDDTGRNQIKAIPRYPRPGSEQYIKFADALDMMMGDA